MRTPLMISALLLNLSMAMAGDKVGNGGGLWACRVGGEIRQLMLVDLFEARAEFGLTLKEFEGMSGDEIFYDRSVFLKEKIPTLFRQLERHIEHVKLSIRPVDGELTIVDDSLFRVFPKASSCEGGRWQYEQLANFTQYGVVLLNKELWDNPLLAHADRGALLVHEAVYKWLREVYKDEDSIRARAITGVVFSDLAAQDMEARITHLLGGDVKNPPPESGIVDNNAGFFLKPWAMHEDDTESRMILHRADSAYGTPASTRWLNVPCAIMKDAPASERDIFCVLEAGELELNMSTNGLGLQVHMPEGMCTYFKEVPTTFYEYAPGSGPATVSFERNSNGTISDGQNSRNGSPYCSYDYTDQGGPNCCVGEYSLSVITHNSDGTQTVITTQESWSGNVSSCLGGYGASSAFSKNFYGFPRATLLGIQKQGMNIGVEINGHSPTQLFTNSNVYLANSYDPTKFAAGRPLAMTAPMNVPKHLRYKPHDSYEYQCLDSAGGLLARIRMQIREWNSYPIVEGGDPRAGSNEYLDWMDYMDGYPGEMSSMDFLRKRR